MIGGGDQDAPTDVEVRGVEVDDLARCAHYHTERDVLAVGFPCCGAFYACFACHAAVADHPAERWRVDERAARALLCGACGNTFAIETYLASPLSCPECGAAFNPGCRDHRDRYFET